MRHGSTQKAAAARIVRTALAVLLCMGGCRRSREGAVNVMGSTSVHPFAEMLAHEFNKRHDFRVNVEGGGSTMGIRAVADGLVDIGMSSRALKPDENFRTVTIAWDGIAVVIHKDNPVNALTVAQLRGIFAGGITNWNAVGGPDRPIRLVTREEGSGTREAFSSLVMTAVSNGKKKVDDIYKRALTQESSGAVIELVRHDPAAIGYISLGLVSPQLKAIDVQVNGRTVRPTSANVKNKSYPLVRPFLFLYPGEKPSPHAQQYIDFVMSAQGQHMLEGEGLVSAREEPK